jgi:hypothetical protein
MIVVRLHPIDEDVADATTAIPRDTLADPWDRFIVSGCHRLSVAPEHGFSFPSI